METIYRDIRNIAADERRFFESVVGHTLGDDECVVIRVINYHTEPERGPNGDLQEWSDEKNRRRCELIDKQIEESLSREEAIELDDLQRMALAYRDKVAPLPMEGALGLHRELLEKKRRFEAEG